MAHDAPSRRCNPPFFNWRTAIHPPPPPPASVFHPYVARYTPSIRLHWCLCHDKKPEKNGMRVGAGVCSSAQQPTSQVKPMSEASPVARLSRLKPDLFAIQRLFSSFTPGTYMLVHCLCCLLRRAHPHTRTRRSDCTSTASQSIFFYDWGGGAGPMLAGFHPVSHSFLFVVRLLKARAVAGRARESSVPRIAQFPEHCTYLAQGTPIAYNVPSTPC